MPTTYDGTMWRSTPEASSVTGDTGIGRVSETEAERRLREMNDSVDDHGQMCMFLDIEDQSAIDAGREALELLRRMPVDAVRGPVGADWLKFRAALLARCEGEK